MSDESGVSGWLWFIIDVGMVAVFGIVLGYGVMQYRRRRRDRLNTAPEYKEGG